MSDDPTPLSLPPNLPYPITLTRLIVGQGDDVVRGTRLAEYSFMSRERRRLIDEKRSKGSSLALGEEGNDLSGTWDCLVQGQVVGWEKGVGAGMVVERRDAKRPLLTVLQPCSHPVQLHGMCGVCGADLTEDDYLATPAPVTSEAGPSRYHGGHEVTHDAMGVTVSTNEAKRLDNMTRDTLLAARKLSLIVDLDQTIIHTTVDPTVAEWMNEIEQDRQDQDQRSTTPDVLGLTDLAAAEDGANGPTTNPESTTPPTSPHPDKLPLPVISPSRPPREKNPNAEALQDVAKFQIADDLPPGYVSKRKLRPGERAEGPARWYFTKPRPGLQTFLEEISELYEMHVYTMGTRTYADAICKVIDPDGKIFGGRILSRDESGSFSSKNLKRLFPTDTSMVVVIDDRSDVWGDCPNLVKVIPYDFFIGIGDINSSFLPKTPKQPTPSSAASAPSLSASSSSDLSTPPPTTPPGDPSEEDELLLKTKLLDEVSESRPLAKMQEELEKQPLTPGNAEEQVSLTDERSGTAASATDGDGSPIPSTSSLDSAETTSTPPGSPAKPRKPLLNPNDYELLRVADILRDVHSTFYDAYDRSGKMTSGPLPMDCDVEFIIPEMKGRVFEDCTLVFSGLIPQMVDPSRTDIWQTAETFGARCQTRVTDTTTHCVTATLNTEKTYYAHRKGAKVVWPSWFWDSVALWKRQEEGKYLAGGGGGGSKSGTSTPAEKEEKRSSPSLVIESVASGHPAEERNGESSTSTSTRTALESIANTGDEGMRKVVSVSVGGADGKGPESSNKDEADDEPEDFDDDEDVGKGWDEGADEEFEAFMAGEDEVDFGSEAGSVAGSVVGSASDIGSAPPTPRKRVRYADEMSLPLEDFKDPPERSESPPKKRKKPLLLLEAPTEGEVPEANKFQYRPKPGGKSGAAAVVAAPEGAGPGAGRTEGPEDTGEGEEDSAEVADAEEGDGGGSDVGDDEFAMMLMDSLAEGGDEEEEAE